MKAANMSTCLYRDEYIKTWWPGVPKFQSVSRGCKGSSELLQSGQVFLEWKGLDEETCSLVVRKFLGSRFNVNETAQGRVPRVPKPILPLLEPNRPRVPSPVPAPTRDPESVVTHGFPAAPHLRGAEITIGNLRFVAQWGKEGMIR